jgi:putative transposase
MSIQFTQGKLEGQERKEVLQEVQKCIKNAALGGIKPVFTAFLEAEQEAKLGRAKGEARRVSSQPREIDWVCRYCGCRDANQFIRDGHYRRDLATSYGVISDLQVPMLECQCCGHDVICSFAILDKYDRFWYDLDQQAIFGSGLCQSLRDLCQQWSANLESQVSLRTIHERINHIEPLIQQARSQSIEEVPPVVQFDGIWLTIVGQDETIKIDKKGRKRKMRHGKHMVVLVALGFWPDGRREVLDWEIASSEAHTEWQKLLERLHKRGLTLERGLQAIVRDGCGALGEAVALVYGSKVIEQHCIFHKLRNVADKSREDLKGEEHKATRQQLLAEASAIYEAKNAQGARERLAAFVQKWSEFASKAVACLQRDFEQTIAFYALQGFSRQIIRTTSLLERTNRQLRRKFRQAGSFGSSSGASVALFLQAQRLNAGWSQTKNTWWEVSQSLFFDLLNLHP